MTTLSIMIFIFLMILSESSRDGIYYQLWINKNLSNRKFLGYLEHFLKLFTFSIIAIFVYQWALDYKFSGDYFLGMSKEFLYTFGFYIVNRILLFNLSRNLFAKVPYGTIGTTSIYDSLLLKLVHIIGKVTQYKYFVVIIEIIRWLLVFISIILLNRVFGI